MMLLSWLLTKKEREDDKSWNLFMSVVAKESLIFNMFGFCLREDTDAPEYPITFW